ncbi:MAG TPA: hypothetical protein PLY09_01160 [Methanothrix sp.]|nr:hypothetical protein [Methanothrix sp.]
MTEEEIAIVEDAAGVISPSGGTVGRDGLRRRASLESQTAPASKNKIATVLISSIPSPPHHRKP